MKIYVPIENKYDKKLPTRNLLKKFDKPIIAKENNTAIINGINKDDPIINT